MVQKTLRKSFWSVLVLTALCSSAWAKVLVRKEPPVTISVHNDADIPLDVLRQAESEASRIFRQSGVEIHWLNCLPPQVFAQHPSGCATASFPRYLQLRIAKRSLNLNEFTMGIAYLSADGIGCYADLFSDRAREIQASSHVSTAIILGHGIAHEIGHLLLGSNSHAPTGIMRARWQFADLASANEGRLLFSPLESQEMRNKLAAWLTHARNDSPIDTARLGD
ncbi:MAG TPA: hypothetical protein VJO16_05330 [Candidatus Acidoferrum sp.]|nr:hypothetical protein [Candidatus Acidoferrum sp.]